MKSSMIQRFTTGMVAAAALAVFVGGGGFIAKQQKDKSAVTSSTPASQIAEQRPENFLGGTGAVHAMQSAERGGLAMYDDENFYFGGMTGDLAGFFTCICELSCLLEIVIVSQVLQML